MMRRFLPENPMEAVLLCLVITADDLPLEASSLTQVIGELVDVLVLHLSHHHYQVFCLALTLGKQVASKLITFLLHFFLKLVFLVDLNIKEQSLNKTFLPEKKKSTKRIFQPNPHAMH